MDEREIQLRILVKSKFWNQLKWRKGQLLGRLQKLDAQQEDHFAQNRRLELQKGVFEKKVLTECDYFYEQHLVDLLKELGKIFRESKRQDPRSYWEAIKKSLFEICEDSEAIEDLLRPYVKSLHYGNFTGTRILHINWKQLILDWIQELRGSEKYFSLSTSEERKSSLIPDVLVCLGTSEDDERFLAIRSCVKKNSQGMATVDRLDLLHRVDIAKRSSIAEKWLRASPLVIVDTSHRSPTTYAIFGYRNSMREDIVALCQKDKWDEKALSLFDWPIILYDDLSDLEARLGLYLCELFDQYEFSGDPDIIL